MTTSTRCPVASVHFSKSKCDKRYCHLKQLLSLIRHGIPSTSCTYTIYESKITEVVQPIIFEISSSINAKQSQNYQKITKDLIQLGMQLKSFASKGLELLPGREFQVMTYDIWFKGGLDQWCKLYASFELLSRSVIRELPHKAFMNFNSF